MNLEEAREALAVRLALTTGSDATIPRLVEALTHPSYSNETGASDNQRLEFLGDAVLGVCVSEQLCQDFPEADEGTLTRMRSALVNAEALARWGRAVGLGGCIALGRGARMSVEQAQTNVIADAVEALVAAVYEAHGMVGVRRLVAEIVRENGEPASSSGRDPKSELQERVQARGDPAPTYHVVSAEGPAHAPHFIVEVKVKEVALARGEGGSKRQAERAAASAALVAEPAGG